MDVVYACYLCNNFFDVTNGKHLKGMIPSNRNLVKRVIKPSSLSGPSLTFIFQCCMKWATLHSS